VNVIVGEPLDETTWHWYHDVVGSKEAMVVDTYWQTGKVWNNRKLSKGDSKGGNTDFADSCTSVG